jgi:dolichol-phosphate mannosyltransferase
VAESALAIVPTYNEVNNLRLILPQILEQDPRLEVLVVDDNSPDGTGKLADEISEREPRVHVLHRPSKLGLGTAYRAGFRWALERTYEYILEMDADHSHDPKHIPQFLAAAESADLVLGSRYLGGRVTVVNWPMPRLLLSYFANIYARIVTGVRLHDATGGFKCFRRRVLETIDLERIQSNGYAFQIEMSVRAARRGFRIKEIPIVFVDRTDGVSKMSGAIVREAVWVVWRLRMQSLFGRL